VSDRVKVYYNTWGSYGQHSLSIAILRNGTIVNPLQIERPPRHTVVRKKIGDVEVEVENSSSAKNAHITVYIPADAVLAVLERVRTSSGTRGWEITYGEGDVEVVEEEEVREVVKGGRRFKEVVRYWCYYYIPEGAGRVLFWREEAERSLVALDKPRVRILKGAIIVAEGDTYEVRDALKKLGFRWNGERWVLPGGNDLERVIEELRKVAEVEVASDDLTDAITHLEVCLEKLKNYLSVANSPEIARIVDELYVIKLKLQRMREGGEEE